MKISMQDSRPYRTMATTCRTRPMTIKHIGWTHVESEPFMGGRFQVRVMRRDLIRAATDLWRLAYPELYGSPHEFVFDPDEYERWVALDETWEEDSRTKVYCMPVVEEVATHRVVSATLLTKSEKNLQVEFTFAATHPDLRQRELTAELRRVTHAIAGRSGAEYFTTFCETWHDITQNWCLKGGWKIAGIFPGNFVRWHGRNEEYRGCTVHFYKFVGEGQEFATKPSEWHLAPPVKKVWEALSEANEATQATERIS